MSVFLTYEIVKGEARWVNVALTTRVRVNGKMPKITVGITLPPCLITEARKRNLDISEICEQALSSILEYVQTQNKPESSKVLNPCSFQENGVDGAGFEPAELSLLPKREPSLRENSWLFSLSLKVYHLLFGLCFAAFSWPLS